MGKRWFAQFFLFFFCLLAGFSKGLSFQILQHNDSLNDVCRATLLIEDEILNSFFERGFIVSNEPAAVSNSAEKDEKFYKDAFNEAANGSLENFVQIKLFFTGGEKENFNARLGNIQKIEWKLVSVKNGSVLEEGSKAVTANIRHDEEADVREFANEFAIHLYNRLNRKA